MKNAVTEINKSWIKISFIYLVIVAIMGLLLRMMFFAPPARFNFKNILHTHSHTALLGWLYAAFYALLIYYFLPEKAANNTKYKKLFWFTQFTVLGMLFSFPVQGYGAVSITFSTLHILASYVFIYYFLKDLKQEDYQILNPVKHSVSVPFVKASLFFMALSSLGPWMMGPVMASGNNGTPLYYLPIYFYLHFQYNGWFSFALFGLFFKFLERNNIIYPKQYAINFYRLMLYSCIPAYLLSTLWVKPPVFVYLIAGLAAVMQVAALVYFIKLIFKIRKELLQLFNNWITFLMVFALSAFILKIVFQFISAIPFAADLAYNFRNFIIGYLHLALIGFISIFLLALLIKEKALKLDKYYSKAGLTLFIFGFVSSEVLLFTESTLIAFKLGNIPHYFELLFWVSVPIPLGLLLFLKNQFVFNFYRFPVKERAILYTKKI